MTTIEGDRQTRRRHEHGAAAAGVVRVGAIGHAGARDRSYRRVVVAALAACRPSASVAPADPHARARARLELLGAEVGPKLTALDRDGDPVFQREVLARIEPMVATGDTQPARDALLFDRVARAEGRAQRYGTQGECREPGTWVAAETEDPASLDERRSSVGPSAMTVYAAENSELCP